MRAIGVYEGKAVVVHLLVAGGIPQISGAVQDAIGQSREGIDAAAPAKAAELELVYPCLMIAPLAAAEPYRAVVAAPLSNVIVSMILGSIWDAVHDEERLVLADEGGRVFPF